MAVHSGCKRFISEWDETSLSSEKIKMGNVIPFLVYTSNIDRHHTKSGIEEEQINEIHGDIENWFCRSCKKVESVPPDVQFNVDLETMLANETTNESVRYKDKKFHNWNNNRPMCECGGQVRPNILMFGDNEWVGSSNDHIYFRWKLAMQKLCANEGWKLVIIEIGCGVNVPTVRNFSEFTLREVPGAKLIRVNPDAPFTRNGLGLAIDEDARVVSIKSGARAALEAIEKHLFPQ